MRMSQKCSIAVHCLLFIHEYGEQTNVTSTLLSMSTGCNPVVIRNILSGLKKAGIITGNSGTGNARLAKEPDEITLYDILTSIDPRATENLIGMHPAPSQHCPVGRNIRGVLEKPYERISEDLKASMQTILFSGIVEDYHARMRENTP